MRDMDKSWDIFCNVIDNYGDIGFSWRLARILAGEHGLTVRLWVDDLQAFRHLCPSLSVDAESQFLEGVNIRAWRAEFSETVAAQVVIEAFGCKLPDVYLNAMAASTIAPVWINLEYLSAEPWVDAHHGLPSPHPQLSLTKYFYFPGYTAATGGMPVEAGLAEQRDAFVDTRMPAFWHSLGLEMPAADELRVSLFAYENPALPALLDAWVADPRRVTCLVPKGRILPQLAAWLEVSTLHVGDVHQRGSLHLHIVPFADQAAYDRLLWACDLNLVRGEDSCVRAQWAARPLIWQAYPQADQAHWDKVDALLQRNSAGLEHDAAAVLDEMWRCWNGMSATPDLAACWSRWRAVHAVLAQHARAWPATLGQAGRLSTKLVEFAENKIK